jgi:hypothetical protein
VANGIIQLDGNRTLVTLSAEEVARRQHQFEERHFLQLPGLLSPELLSVVMPRLACAVFSETTYEAVGTDLRMAENGVLEGLHLAVNDAPFLSIIETLTGCRPLRVFAGRVYRMTASAGHTTAWHDDVLSPNRRVGLSVNLSAHPYGGGVFQLRRTADERLLGEVHNLGLGDAVLFRLSPQLQHRVTDVTGEHAKTAFAGWFRPDTSYRDALLLNSESP